MWTYLASGLFLISSILFFITEFYVAATLLLLSAVGNLILKWYLDELKKNK